MTHSQGKTSLQHPRPFTCLQLCPEDQLAGAGSSSLTLAPFCNKPAYPAPLWLCCYSTLVTTGLLGREWGLRGPQAKLLDLLWQAKGPRALNPGDKLGHVICPPNSGGHPGHTYAPPSICVSPTCPPGKLLLILRKPGHLASSSSREVNHSLLCAILDLLHISLYYSTALISF